jgi:Yos1-like
MPPSTDQSTNLRNKHNADSSITTVVGWGRTQADAGFGGRDDSGTKARSVDLIASVRTVMRSELEVWWEGELEGRSWLTFAAHSTADSDQHNYHIIRTCAGLEKGKHGKIKSAGVMGVVGIVREACDVQKTSATLTALLYMEVMLQAVQYYTYHPSSSMHQQGLEVAEIKVEMPRFLLRQATLATLPKQRSLLCHPSNLSKRRERWYQ